MDFIRAVILGIIEGLTEFIPVSSTGHLIVAGSLLEFKGEFAKTFDISIQLGAILAVIIVYKSNFIKYLKLKPDTSVFPNVYHLILTTLPALAAGYLLHKYIKEYLFSPFTVAIGLILGSFLMLLADYYNKYYSKKKKLTYMKSFYLGCFQCLALWPGMSRSGSTISGGIFLGLDHLGASAYSFIAAVPVMLAATAYELLKTQAVLNYRNIMILSVGFVISFIIGWLSIIFFLKLISKIKLLPFAIYRIIIAIIILMSSLGSLNAAFVIIKSDRKNMDIPVYETIEHPETGSFLHVLSLEKPDLIKDKEKFGILSLDNMFVRIRSLPPYLFLRKGDTKIHEAEFITGGRKAYLFLSKVRKSKDALLDYLKKAGISYGNKRIYFELCIEEKNITKILWSYEYDVQSENIRLVKDPSMLKFAGLKPAVNRFSAGRASSL